MDETRLALEAVIRSKQVYYLPHALGGCKDVNEAFTKGLLQTNLKC